MQILSIDPVILVRNTPPCEKHALQWETRPPVGNTLWVAFFCR